MFIVLIRTISRITHWNSLNIYCYFFMTLYVRWILSNVQPIIQCGRCTLCECISFFFLPCVGVTVFELLASSVPTLFSSISSLQTIDGTSASILRPRLFRKSRMCWTINSIATEILRKHKIECEESIAILDCYSVVCNLIIIENWDCSDFSVGFVIWETETPECMNRLKHS